MSAPTDENVSTIGQRVKFAIDAEGRSQNSLETELKKRGFLGKSRGAISSLISGRRGTKTTSVETLIAIADILHVRLDWLLKGELPMKRDGRVEQTPFEIAMAWARHAGCREDAIQGAWAKFGAQEPPLGPHEWSLAFDREARDLDMRKVPRPEVIVATQEAIRKQQKRLKKQHSAPPAADEPIVTPSARPRRASGGI